MTYDYVFLTRNTAEAQSFMQGFSCSQQLYAAPKFIVWLCIGGTAEQIITMQSNSLVPYSTRLS